MIKAATFTAAAAFALSAVSFSAAAQESTDAYVRSIPAGVVVKHPFGDCVRTGYWTPAMANSECDPDLAPKPAAAAPSAPPPPPPPAAAKPAPPEPPRRPAGAAEAHRGDAQVERAVRLQQGDAYAGRALEARQRGGREDQGS